MEIMTSEIISNLSDNLNSDAKNQLFKIASKYDIKHKYIDSGIRFRISLCEEIEIPKKSYKPLLKKAVIWTVSLVFILLLTNFLSNKFELNLYQTILFEIGTVFFVFLLVAIISLSVQSLYKNIENKVRLDSFTDDQQQEKSTDSVLSVINETFDSLSLFREERLRQAKNSYNIALTLIIAGIVIVFIGVYLLFKKNLTQGSVTTGVGAISNIIGSTVLKFYKDTNNRMDLIDSDLFILNSVKVQYSLILKINNESERNKELSKLIESIGQIKKQ